MIFFNWPQQQSWPDARTDSTGDDVGTTCVVAGECSGGAGSGGRWLVEVGSEGGGRPLPCLGVARRTRISGCADGVLGCAMGLENWHRVHNVCKYSNRLKYLMIIQALLTFPNVLTAPVIEPTNPAV